MPDAPLAAHRMLVINTTPIIALAVVTGSLDILRICYDRVIVPHEVQQEILARRFTSSRYWPHTDQ